MIIHVEVTAYGDEGEPKHFNLREGLAGDAWVGVRFGNWVEDQVAQIVKQYDNEGMKKEGEESVF